MLKESVRKLPGFLRPPGSIRIEKACMFTFPSSPWLYRSGERSRAACDHLTWERWMRWWESGGSRQRKRSRDDLPGEGRMERFGEKDSGGGGGQLHLSKCDDYVKTVGLSKVSHQQLDKIREIWRAACSSVSDWRFSRERTLPLYRKDAPLFSSLMNDKWSKYFLLTHD